MSDTSDFGGGGGGGSDSGFSSSESAPAVDVSPESGKSPGWDDSRDPTVPALDPDFYTPTLDATGGPVSDLRQRTTQPALKVSRARRPPWPQRVEAISRVLTEQEKREESLARRELQAEIESFARRRPSAWLVAVGILALGVAAGVGYAMLR